MKTKNPTKKLNRYQIHDAFFKDRFSKAKYMHQLMQIKFNRSQYNSLQWETLKLEVNFFIDKNLRETRADLVFSVAQKNSKKCAHFLISTEHKSSPYPKTMGQSLDYQSGLYRRFGKKPVIPFIVYAGKSSQWTGPKSFHEYLGLKSGSPFHEHILNFRPILFNLQKEADLFLKQKLTICPILYIMVHAWSVTKEKLKECYKLGLNVRSLRERREVMESVVGFARRMNPHITLKTCVEVEARAVKNKEDRVMTLVELEREELKRKAMLRGVQKGRAEGRAEGQKKVIMSMLKEKAKLSFISKVTGYSIPQIKKLKNGNSSLKNGV